MEPCSVFVDRNMDVRTVFQRNGASILKPSHTLQVAHKIGPPIWDARCGSSEPLTDGTGLFSGSKTAKIHPDADSSNENGFHSAYPLCGQCDAIFDSDRA